MYTAVFKSCQLGPKRCQLGPGKLPTWSWCTQQYPIFPQFGPPFYRKVANFLFYIAQSNIYTMHQIRRDFWSVLRKLYLFPFSSELFIAGTRYPSTGVEMLRDAKIYLLKILVFFPIYVDRRGTLRPNSKLNAYSYTLNLQLYKRVCIIHFGTFSDNLYKSRFWKSADSVGQYMQTSWGI